MPSTVKIFQFELYALIGVLAFALISVAYASDDELEALLREAETTKTESAEESTNQNVTSTPEQPDVSTGEEVADKVDETPAAKKPEGLGTIEEIVVTATKRAESVRDLPFSIDAFTGKDLEDRGATGLEEILKYSPGVTFKKGGHADSSSITIRGIGGTSKFFNRTFGLFFQDTPLVNPSLLGPQPDIDPFDMRAVEILKGPQGTLFGGSALAGAVRYVPNTPVVGESSGNFSFGYGSVSGAGDPNRAYSLMHNIPVGETVALRLTGSLREFAGYVDNTYSGEDDINNAETRQYIIQGQWEPSEEWTLNLLQLDRKAQNDDTSTVDNEGNEDNRHVVSGKRVKEDGLSEVTINTLNLTYSGYDPFSVNWSSNHLDKSGLVHLDVGRPYRAQDIPGGKARQEQVFWTDQISHELRLVSNDNTQSDYWLLDSWKYVVGLFYLESEQYFELDVPVPSVSLIDAVDSPELSPLSPLFIDPIRNLISALPDTGEITAGINVPATSTAKEKALYFDATKYMMNERLELNLGGRFYDQNSVGVIPVYVVARTAGIQEVSTLLDEASATLEESGFNPKVAVTWHWNDNFTNFASIVKGFRFGGFNTDPYQTGEPNITFESDSLWNYELGLRTTWLGGAMQWDITAFYLKWDNMQIEEFSSLATAYILNIGGSENLGAEMSFKSVLPYGFFVLANLAYSDARYTESFTTPSGGEGHEGDKLPNSPQWTGSAALSYNTALRDWEFGADLYYSYQGESKNDFENNIPLDAFETFGLSFRVSNANLPMSPELSLTVTNLFDERAALYGLYETVVMVNQFTTREVLQPRMVTMSMKFNF
ncbi:TonB-dependent receptor [Spongiibacter sp. KMU-158]|uniref:TonB-dependent receptor n=1 Tax=Spongiibacter pelagi TaxID=2760804 RepID=A0A927C5A5_9GAMM|nr:TonB-dependent receptor [Spongiibacter pelagi]MBD2860272.1 TonB-dependent receptor [Spongiibacter pelagi]